MPSASIMRTRIYGNGWTCSCGASQRSGTHVPLAISGALASQHIASLHPVERAPGVPRGCHECSCAGVYEPIVSADDRCPCGHLVRRHDVFCCVEGCEDVLTIGSGVVSGDAAYLLCEGHQSEFAVTAGGHA